MKKPKISEVRRDLKLARLSRDTDRQIQLYETALSVRPGSEEFLRPLARLLTGLGRNEEACAVWESDFDHLNSLEAACGILSISGDSPKKRAIMERLESEHGADVAQAVQRIANSELKVHNSARHIAICGMSYCGSSLLEAILGGIPGVGAIGESHWLIHNRRGVGNREVDFSDANPDDLEYCWSCGKDCSVLSMEFRHSLSLRRKNWYQQIARRLGCQILVSSDKNFPKYVSLDPMLRFDAVILFKSPRQAWWSFYKRLPKDLDDQERLEKLHEFLPKWIRVYKEFLLSLDPLGKKIILYFDAFASAPEKHTHLLCERLGLSYKEAFLEEHRPMHTIGGNVMAMTEMYGQKKVAVRALSKPRLPQSHCDVIDANSDVAELLDALCAAYLKDFGKISKTAVAMSRSSV